MIVSLFLGLGLEKALQLLGLCCALVLFFAIGIKIVEKL